MPYTTINKSSDYFNTKLYSGTGSSNAITGVGFQPDFTWIKRRDSATNHFLVDAVRGATKYLVSYLTSAETTNTETLKSFDSDGFTVGTNGDINNSAGTFASWNWLANGAGSSNTDGSITSTVSANTTSGFSIVQWTGTGSNATIGHGLGATPKWFIMKKTSATSAWSVYHESVGNTAFMTLNATSDSTTSSTVFNNTSPTSSVFSVGTADNGNASGATYIGYFFAEKKGFSKFGSYQGNSSSDGAFIYTGFRPAWVMIKQSSSSGNNWWIIDNKRVGYNSQNNVLFASLSNAEETSVANNVEILSNGFKLRATGSGINASGSTYIYMAFAEAPLVGSNNVPCTAR